MPLQFTRSDSLREYLTGAGSDGGAQASPSASLGGFRSSTEAVSLGITITSPISGVSVLYAGGSNGAGIGTLAAVDSSHLTWKAPGDGTAGTQVQWTGAATQIVESSSGPGSYLRISATPPFTPGTSQITLTVLYNNAFGFDNVTITQASSGVSQYRATMVRNEASTTVGNLQRYIGQLGTQQTSGGGGLPASGAGTITTTGTFADWPTSGWCQVQTSGGALREVIYYTSRTVTQLTVPAAGRARLGTTAAAGSVSDKLFAVPGVAIAIDPTLVQAFGTSIQTTASQTTAPIGVTWNLGLTAATGLQIGDMAVSTQVGIWMWKEVPAGTVATPSEMDILLDSFNAF